MCFGLQGSWEDHQPLVEFYYNNSYLSTIGMKPLELLYGRPCRSTCWFDSRDPLIVVGPKMIVQTIKVVDLIRKSMK